MSQCNPCSGRFTYNVAVDKAPASLVWGTKASATYANSLLFTITADACCSLTQTKQKKAVLLKAICDYVSANSAAVLAADPAFYAHTQDASCCGCGINCDSFEEMQFDLANNRVLVTLASVSGLPADDATNDVVAPFAETGT